jgi:hypothetical protein
MATSVYDTQGACMHSVVMASLEEQTFDRAAATEMQQSLQPLPEALSLRNAAISMERTHIVYIKKFCPQHERSQLLSCKVSLCTHHADLMSVLQGCLGKHSEEVRGLQQSARPPRDGVPGLVPPVWEVHRLRSVHASVQQGDEGRCPAEACRGSLFELAPSNCSDVNERGMA